MKIINLDKEIFEHAFILCEKKFSYEEIINVLKNGSDVEKQIAILKIRFIENHEDAKLLVSHLTGQDGPIRESVAVKLNELLVENCKIFDDVDFYPTYVDAVCDVNPNVSRNVISYLPKLEFAGELFDLLIKKTEKIFERIEKPDTEQKNFLTVRLFNLYWCLEAIGELLVAKNNLIVENRLNGLLEKSAVFNNYTIDEKIARIISLPFFNDVRCKIEKKIQNTDNFYVKRYLKQ